MANNELDKVAEMAKEEFLNPPIPHTEVDGDGPVDIEEDPFVMGGAVTPPPTEEKNTAPSDEDGLFVFNDTDPEKKYIRDLVDNFGFSHEEAEKAAKKKFHPDEKSSENEASNVSEKKEENKEETVIVKAIDPRTLNFTDEEKKKLEKSTVIHLIEVEDEELKSIKVKKYKRRDKFKIMSSMNKSISRYQTPLPTLGEFATFKGAQTQTLLHNVINSDDTYLDALKKKASLIYDRLIGGVTFSKYDEDGKLSLSYDEFLEKFKLMDVDMALYAIFVASSRENAEISIGCSNADCNAQFIQHYNIQSLLKADSIPDVYKEKMDNIIANKGNSEVIEGYIEEANKIKRVKSNNSGNIYDISIPSLKKAIQVYEKIDLTDIAMVYNAQLVIYLDSVMLKDPETDEYIIFGYDEDIEKELEKDPDSNPDYDPIRDLFDIVQELPQYDIDLISNMLKDKIVAYEFELKSKCTECGHEMTNRLSIDDMVFLAARGSTAQIE